MLKKGIKARTGFFLYSFHGGGIERVNLNLIGFLLSERHKVDVIVAQKWGEFLDQVPAGARVYDMGKRNAIRCIISVARYLRIEKPDVLFTAIPTVNIVGILANIISGFCTCVIPTEHMPVSLDEKYNTSLSVKVAYKIYPLFYLFVRKIVLNCFESAEDFVHRFPMVKREKLRVIYNPVVSDAMFAKSQDPGEFWRIMKSPNRNAPFILGVGRLTLQKNFDLLIKSFSRVCEKKRCQLVILGEGELENQLKELVGRLNISADVIFPGFVTNPYAFMARAKVFVLSSIYETLPTVLIEALACGSQVVATDCFGVKEILDNGKYGRIVKQEDEDGMVAAINSSLDSEIVDIEERRRRAMEFEVRKSGEQYANLIGEVIQGKGRAKA